MIKNSVFLTILIRSLPLAVFADNNVDFTNSRGTLSGTNSGLTLAGSTLIAVNGLGSGLITGTDLGTLSFRTGNLSSGSLQMGGTLAAGGTFNITGTGTSGIPNGVIFSGTFAGPLTWTVVTLSNGTHNDTLTGSLVGTWQTGTTANGTPGQLVTYPAP